MTSNILSKTCTKCCEEKPLSEFGLKKSSSTGHASQCKKCRNIIETERRKKYKDKYIEYEKQRHARDREKRVAYMKEWSRQNKEKKSEGFKKYYEKNKQDVLSANRKYRKENKEKIKQTRQIYEKNNSEKIKQARQKYHEQNKEKIKERNKIWRRANKHVKRIHNQNRKARMKESGGKLSPDIVKKLFNLQNGKCPCCKKSLGANYHLDHIMPISRGGTNTDDNVQLLRQECNNRKYSKHPVDYMQEMGYLL